MAISPSTDPQPPSPEPAAEPAPVPVACGVWSAVLQKKPVPLPAHSAAPSRVFDSCGSSRGVSVAVVDANAIIHGDKLAGGADKFVTVQEVLDEVRDPASRHRLAFLSLPIETMEPSPEAINTVVKFARETGDYQTLSNVDLKLIALTYTLESQIHGTSHLRGSPPPLSVVTTKNLKETEMPGWGSNVPNLKEWEALDQVAEGASVQVSRILPLKDLDDNTISVASDGKLEDQGNDIQFMDAPRRFFPPKKEIKIEEKKMVASGIDASRGEYTDNVDDWHPAVSRSTHRRYLIRKARREMLRASEEDSRLDLSEGDNTIVPNVDSDNQLAGEGDISNAHTDEDDDDDATCCVRELDDLEISSQNDESIVTTVIYGNGSEQSLMNQSFSDSSVACITSDYAMQNVILQIGLRLLAPGGMQIRQLHKWVLRCHACNNVTQDIGRIFCPKCGNGGTLRKISATVGENGIVLATRRQRMVLRGTKFSLPKPQGGRDAITKNPILREDQLPHKFLHPKSKKKPDKGDGFFTSDDFFSHTGNKKAPLQPPVRRAMALFSGKRNPNDNHFSRPKH